MLITEDPPDPKAFYEVPGTCCDFPLPVMDRLRHGRCFRSHPESQYLVRSSETHVSKAIRSNILPKTASWEYHGRSGLREPLCLSWPPIGIVHDHQFRV